MKEFILGYIAGVWTLWMILATLGYFPSQIKTITREKKVDIEEK